MQEAIYPYNDPGQLPITPLRLPGGEWLRIESPSRLLDVAAHMASKGGACTPVSVG